MEPLSLGTIQETLGTTELVTAKIREMLTRVYNKGMEDAEVHLAESLLKAEQEGYRRGRADGRREGLGDRNARLESMAEAELDLAEAMDLAAAKDMAEARMERYE